MGTEILEDTPRNCVEGIVVDVQGPKSYERMEGEPTEWFTRFTRFMLQGPKRSLLSVYKAELAESSAVQHGSARISAVQSVPGSWNNASKKWDWFARVAAYDIDQIESEKRQVEADRAARRRQLLDDEWHHGTQMVETAAEALRHGHKFFERTTKLIQGKFIETEEVDPKTGKTITVRTKVDREIVYIELKACDISKMLMDGGKKRRMATGLTSEKAQDAFMSLDGGEEMDIAAVDAELLQMFEELGMNKRLPAPEGSPSAPDSEPPGASDPPLNLTDELLPGFDY